MLHANILDSMTKTLHWEVFLQKEWSHLTAFFQKGRGANGMNIVTAARSSLEEKATLQAPRYRQPVHFSRGRRGGSNIEPL